MRPHVSLSILICLLIPFCSTYAQPSGVTIRKKSAWIETIDYNIKAKPDSKEGGSTYYLLWDEQENAQSQEDYYHYAYAILTAEGLQDMADITVDFEPAYQQLFFHEVKVIRNEMVIDQLSPAIKVIQREQSMDRYLYDGTKTAIVNLKDLRVGDVVEYSYTRKGFNPVHKGHLARTYYLEVYSSVEKYFKKLIVPESLAVQVKTIGENVPAYKQRTDAGLVHFTWDLAKVKPTDYEGSVPSWYNTSKIVLFSDFESWAAVGAWAKELFKLNAADEEKIKTKVAPGFKSTDEKDYILEVTHFVQDEIRYLGFETGINSHKPYPPLQVYEQRFGDCKDKSLLLVTLLRARGIEAYPMLVNTSLKHAIEDRLPAGNIFDHCVVKVVYDGKQIYIDPTMSNQGGDIWDYYFPDYSRGLVIDDEVAGLEVLPEPFPSTTTEVQTFSLLTIGGEAVMDVQTTYTGSDADSQRAQFARSSLEDLQKGYKNYYANLYPDIEVFDEMTFKDNRSDNVFTVNEHYKIPAFWKSLDENPGKIYCTVQPLSFNNYFDVPKNIQNRTLPYWQSYPVDLYHTIHINLPEPWTVQPADEVMENDFYQYEYTVSYKNDVITKSTHYQTKTDHIPAERLQDYIKDHQKMNGDLVFQLTFDKDIDEASNNRLPGIAVSIVVILAGAFLMVVLYHRYDPRPHRFMVNGSPIGGWLVVMAIGIVLAPILLIVQFFKMPELITGTTWITWWPAKRYELFAVFLAEHVYNILKLLFSVLLIILFFERRTSFPRLMTIQLGANFIVQLVDSLLAMSISESTSSVDFADVWRGFIAAVIWIPYLYNSQRVKETFVVTLRDEDENLLTPTYHVEEVQAVAEVTDKNEGSEF